MLSYHYKLLRWLGKKAIDYAVKKANAKWPSYKGKRTYYKRGNLRGTSSINAKRSAESFTAKYYNIPWVKLVSEPKPKKNRKKHKMKPYLHIY